MMQKEAQQAERAWEERMSQRDSNKIYFNHLTRDEADIEVNMRLKKYEIEEKTFETSESGERIGTNLLKHYHEDIGTKNREMKALRKIERMKRKTEKKIAKEVEKKTGNMQGIQSWPPPEFPDAEKILGNNPESDPVPAEPEPPVEKVEFKKAKPLPPGLAKRLAARRKRLGLPETEPEKMPEPKKPAFDAEMAEKAAQAAMASFDFSGSKSKLDVDYIKSLMDGTGKPSQPPGLRPGTAPTKVSSDKSKGDFVNMPSENPISIPGLPAGWKFGDAMPAGTPREDPEKEKEKNANPLEVVTRKKKRRPNQPVIFQADALGALVDPTKYTSKQSIEQKNLVPRAQQPRKREPTPPPIPTTPVQISSAPVMTASDQYTAADFEKSYSAGPRRGNMGGPQNTYGTYKASDLKVNQSRNKYNKYKGAGVSGGGYR